MPLLTVLGIAAALCSTISFAPQAWKIVRTRETKDISTGMYLLTVAAFCLWTAYGLALRQWPLVASNGICFLLSAFILAMKLLPRRDRIIVADAIAPGKRPSPELRPKS